MAIAPLVGRIGLGAGALVLAGATGAASAARSAVGDELAVLVVAALGVLAAALVTRRPGLLTVAALLLGAEHVASRVGHDVALGSTVAFSVALLVALELAWWSIDRHPAVAWDRQANRRRGLEILAVAISGAALAAVAGLTAVAGNHAGPAVFVAGLVAAPAAVWFGAAAARTATEDGNVSS